MLDLYLLMHAILLILFKLLLRQVLNTLWLYKINIKLKKKLHKNFQDLSTEIYLLV